MDPRRLVALTLAALALAGCTTPSGAGVQTLNHAGPRDGNVDITSTSLSISSLSNQSGIAIDLPTNLTTTTIHACAAAARTNCTVAGLPNGSIVADGAILALGNMSVNSQGPDRDSALYFFAGGALDGQALRWDDARGRFELTTAIDALGNVTARHHVGTVTTILLHGPSGASQVQIATAATEGNEAAVFYRGSAALVNGVANVTFPPTFKFLVAGNLTAQVTPTSPGAGLYVSDKANDHVTVKTLDGSASSQTFDYFIQATRAGSEDFKTLPSST